jgi:hypothetical protein
MKAKLAMLLAGIVLGSTGFGYAASQSFWHESQGPYACEGTDANVICSMNGSAWRVTIGRLVGEKEFMIMYRNGRPFFACGRDDLPAQCADYSR